MPRARVHELAPWAVSVFSELEALGITRVQFATRYLGFRYHGSLYRWARGPLNSVQQERVERAMEVARHQAPRRLFGLPDLAPSPVGLASLTDQIQSLITLRDRLNVAIDVLQGVDRDATTTRPSRHVTSHRPPVRRPLSRRPRPGRAFLS